jgi:hypothetical protein
MGIVNRRNAVLGWTVWQVGKQVAKSKARRAVKNEPTTRRPHKLAILASLAAAGGLLVFWRKKSADDEGLPPGE